MQDANTQAWTSPSARAEEVCAPFWQAPVPFESVAANKVGPVDIAINAHVNHGNWIAECPDCAGAQFACPDDRRFMCNYCANAMVDGLWRPVVWPKNRAAIDALLMERRLTNQRHWFPHETVRDLKAENIEHGVGA